MPICKMCGKVFICKDPKGCSQHHNYTYECNCDKCFGNVESHKTVYVEKNEKFIGSYKIEQE